MLNGTLVAAELKTALILVMGVYVAIMFGLSAVAYGKVKTIDDFVVAGRKLGFPLALGTLFATWFGAGTLLTAADEVRARGITAATLDPLGAGLCLLIAGLFFAVPMWNAKITTLPELFGRRFSPGTRVAAAALAIPPYLGWIAAQFVALAGLLNLFFGLSHTVGLVLVAVVGIAYTVLGGMWSVTLTDAFQVILILLGLMCTVWFVLDPLGTPGVVGGLEYVWVNTSASHRYLFGTDTLIQVTGWLGVLCAGALGNIPSQDVMQRIFSARSASVARKACLFAGGLYLFAGAMPVILGLAGGVVLEGDGHSTIPQLAALFLNPVLTVVFVLTILSAILSTIDSALLAPATMLAHDIVSLTRSKPTRIAWVRWSVVLIGVLSLGLALIGESAFALLESGYELGMVSLMAPLVFALFVPWGNTMAVLTSMSVGTLSWLLHLGFGSEHFLGSPNTFLPPSIGCMLLSFIAFPIVAYAERRTNSSKSRGQSIRSE